MTYSSFAGVFGPGEALKKEFEKNCLCRIQWIKIPDSTLFVQRLNLRSDRFKTDAIVGLDQLSLKSIRQLNWKIILKKKEIPSLVFPKIKSLAPFRQKLIPYNWSPMTFLSRKPIGLIHLKSLLKREYQHNISLPSPSYSTVGLQFLYWIWSIFQEKTSAFLKVFKKQLYGMPPSWSTSYSLFQRGHVDLSFSYLSSLLYHQNRRQKDFYLVEFKEGHPFQVELAGVPNFCKKCDLARQFVKFLLTPLAQKILFKKNYMFPVQSIRLNNSILKRASKMQLISYDQLDNFLDQKDIKFKKWK